MTTNTITYPIEGLHCGACTAKVTKALLPLADEVTVTLAPMEVTLVNPRADLTQLQTAVTGAGKYILSNYSGHINAARPRLAASGGPQIH